MTEQTTDLAAVTKTLFGTNPLEAYEGLLVPRLFAPLAQRVCEVVGISEGDRVLDVASGTGAVSSIASGLAGRSGSVVGVDLSPPMLAVARSKPLAEGSAEVEYREGDAAALPVDDDSFDVVTCQQGMQFFMDRPKAAAEMFRAAAPAGRVAVACWRSVDNLPPFAAIAAAIRQVVGDEKAAFFGAPFAFSDENTLGGLLSDAGFADVRLTQERIPFDFEGGPTQLFSLLATAPPQLGLADVTEEQLHQMLAVITEELVSQTVDGAIRSHAITNLAIATKP